MITVLRAGPLTTVQDEGRPGYAHLGVPRAGALDQPALRLANALVGNDASAAGLETTLMGCRLRFESPATIAVTGAVCTVKIDGGLAGGPGPIAVPAGAVVEIGRATGGVRSYLAVAGGIDVEPVLGSRSTDTLSGLGPPRLTDGQTLAIGPMPNNPDKPAELLARRVAEAARDSADQVRGPGQASFVDRPGQSGPAGRLGGSERPGSATPPREPGRSGGAGQAARELEGSGVSAGRAEIVLGVWAGPRDAWVEVAGLFGDAYVISPMSNRVACRLAGTALRRTRAGELPPEGLVLGAIQVPPDGQPLIFLADHPTTGGYPVVGVVDDVAPLAQARPGTSVRFRELH
ncbi:biotin-dependent carboxyltransferase family protein [Actinoplanes sp. NPDC051411]|uniref:5-oxoprolinase subunit C family protein n=1 Tax=Actinoplanes sp. NPDC051411 TaxID=3155522 RepID=UPI00342DD2B5